jgi:hypothetical protein
MNEARLKELLLQSLEHEQGGVKLYEAAVPCAQREDLREEWTKYLEQTRAHVVALQGVCRKLSIDIAAETPGRKIVRDVGAALVNAVMQARAAGDAEAAQIVACECITLAETKDHQDWQLIGKCALEKPAPQAEALNDAYIAIEDQEDEHLYHTMGWARELWIESLGMPAVIPPPEEEKEVKTAIGAARAEQAREEML